MLAELTKEILQKITMPEAKMVDARLNGYSISQIEKDNLKSDIDLLVFRLSSISGSELPTNDEFASILADELLIYLLDFGYGDLTIEEIVLSFRFNSKAELVAERILPKGFLNVMYVARVLENYLLLRNMLDRKLQNHIDGYE